MSTHYSKCVVCLKETGCCADEHVLGCGWGCDGPEPPIEFCSVDCFKGLRERMADRWKIAVEIHPEWA